MNLPPLRPSFHVALLLDVAAFAWLGHSLIQCFGG